MEVADPYVERLLEGFAFLAARVQLKLDAEFPRFTQALLEIVYPHFLAPTPAMLVAQFKPDLLDPGLATGPRDPAGGSTLLGVAGTEDATCEFRTAHDVRVWPLELVSANYFTFAPDLPLNALPIPAQRIKGGLRLRLRTTAGPKFSQLAIDRLPFYLTGRDDVANRLYRTAIGDGARRSGRAAEGAESSFEWLPAASSLGPVGFTDNEALLPVSLRSFQGYRLLPGCPLRSRSASALSP